MSHLTIGFVGAGNMAQAIIGGLINTGTPASQLCIYEPDEALAQQLVDRLGVISVQSSADLAGDCDVLVFAVKPQVMQVAMQAVSGVSTKPGAFFISVAAGIPIALMQGWLGEAHPLVRVMPNTPALVGAGISGLFASKQVSEQQREAAESVLRAVGSVIWVDQEALIDSVTGISGSGPAYFFYFIEALQQAALEQGLDADQAKILSLETAFGAAKLALESHQDVASLRQRVTSPGGTTAAALDVFKQRELDRSIADAVTAAVERARDLAKLVEQ